MAAFELTARHQIYLGAGNQIKKGERLTLNIHTMGVQPYNLFNNPDSRRQAIQQFSVNGIDVRSREYLLKSWQWDIKRISDHKKEKNVESFNPFSEVGNQWNEIPSKDIIDDVSMKKDCIGLVRNFYNEGLDLDYADKGLEGRCEIATSFYNDVKEKMGIDADLSFANKPPYNLGGYDPLTNRIELNSNYLEKADCEDLLNTILHESRHAFQNKCIDTPNSVTVKDNIIEVWRDNFDNYIRPDEDFEAYENQEIEKDANYFADSVMKKGTNPYYA